MLFIVLANDRPNALEKRLALRPAHIDYWSGQPGLVQIAGAMLTSDDGAGSPKGSAFLLEAESLEAVKTLVAADPFAREGVFGDDIRFEILRPGLGAWLKA